MTTPTPPRASTSVAFRVAEAVGGGIYRLIAGGILGAPGAFGFYMELHHNYGCDEQLRAVPIALYVGLMVAGALVVTPSLGKSLTDIVVTVFPGGIPFLGGRRRDDPPAP